MPVTAVDPRLGLRHGDKGVPGGVAELDDTGTLPLDQVPGVIGGGGAYVGSVNGHTGAVVLSYADVGAVSASDPRLGDQRTPLDASVTAAKVAASLKPSGTAAAGTEALRALGTTAGTAAAGDDPRLSDARAPTGAAGGVLSGTYPSPGLAASVALPGTPTLGTPPTWPDSSATVASTGFVTTAIGTRATSTPGIVPLADYPRTTGETDDTGRFTRAINYGLTNYPSGFVLLVPYGGFSTDAWPSMQDKINITIRGVGGVGSGGGTATTIFFTGTAARFVDFRHTYGCFLEDLTVQYTNAGFTGTLVDWRNVYTASGAFGGLRRVSLGGQNLISNCNELVAIANNHTMHFDTVYLQRAVCGIRGREGVNDWCNNNTFRGIHTTLFKQAPIQDVAGESNVFINPTGEPLGIATTAGGGDDALNAIYGRPSAGWSKTTTAYGGGRGLTVIAPWFGDSDGTGTWIDYTGSGLSVRGGSISGAATAIKLGAASSAAAVQNVLFESNGVVFDIGANCQFLDLIPNYHPTTGVSANTTLVTGASGIFSSRLPKLYGASPQGDPKLAGQWFADSLEIETYLVAYRATANQVVLGRKDATATVAPGVVLGDNTTKPYVAAWRDNSTGQLVLDASVPGGVPLVVRNRDTTNAASLSGVQFNDGANTAQAFVGLAEGAGGVYTATGGYFRVNPGSMPLRLMYNGTTRIEADTNGLGFFGATPAAKPGATTGLKAGLVSLGLITGGGATPLDLGGGLLTAGGASFTSAPTVGPNAIPVTIGATARKMNMGSSSVTFTASATSAQVTVAHGLGATPVVVMCFAKAPENGLIILKENAAADGTNIYIVGRQTQNTAVSATQNFYWLAWA